MGLLLALQNFITHNMDFQGSILIWFNMAGVLFNTLERQGGAQMFDSLIYLDSNRRTKMDGAVIRVVMSAMSRSWPASTCMQCMKLMLS